MRSPVSVSADFPFLMVRFLLSPLIFVVFTVSFCTFTLITAFFPLFSVTVMLAAAGLFLGCDHTFVGNFGNFCIAGFPGFNCIPSGEAGNLHTSGFLFQLQGDAGNIHFDGRGQFLSIISCFFFAAGADLSAVLPEH